MASNAGHTDGRRPYWSIQIVGCSILTWPWSFLLVPFYAGSQRGADHLPQLIVVGRHCTGQALGFPLRSPCGSGPDGGAAESEASVQRRLWGHALSRLCVLRGRPARRYRLTVASKRTLSWSIRKIRPCRSRHQRSGPVRIHGTHHRRHAPVPVWRGVKDKHVPE